MKYLRTFLLALQAEFLSRVNIVGWFVVGLLPAFAIVLIWLTVLGDKPSINGFTKGDFIVYYLFMTLSWYIVGGTFGTNLGYSFKNGSINTTLLKPYNVVLKQALEEQAWKVLSLFVSIPAMIILYLVFGDQIHISLSATQSLQLTIALVLGGIIFGFLQALVGLSTFWITEVWAAAELNDVLVSFFGGRYVPLALLPAPVLMISNLLPFKYTFYTPVSILLGKTTSPWIDIAIQAVYVLILYAIYRVVWILGIKRYEAVGA